MTPTHSSSLPAEWPRVWRGESGGDLFETFDMSRTRHGVGFFFAQHEDHATFYAGAGTQPRSFALDPGRCLDLTDPYRAVRQDPGAAAVLTALREGFDEWIDRYSGEPMDLAGFLETGSLYDYEGTGSAERWNQLFIEAAAGGYDSVRVRDITDGFSGEDAIVWVVFDPARIHFLPSPTPADPRPSCPAPRI